MTGWVCPECGRELRAQLVKLGEVEKMISEAADQPEGFYPVTATDSTVRISCSCSHVDMAFEAGNVKAWDVPEEWKAAYIEDEGVEIDA